MGETAVKHVKKLQKKQIAGIAGGAVLGIIIALLPPFGGLEKSAMVTLGVFVWTIIQWVAGTMNIGLASVIMVLLFAVFRCAPLRSVFSGFTGTTWRFMFGAMGMNVALIKSGMMKRIAHAVIRVFPASFRGQTAGMMTVGLVMTPLIPSITAKTIIAMPIAKSVTTEMGYQNRSRELHGLWVAGFVGVNMASCLVMNASFYCYFAYGQLPEAVRQQIGWVQWVLAALPWGVVTLGLCLIFIQLMYGPKRGSESKEQAAARLASIKNESKQPLSTDEKVTGLVFAVAILLWATENLHGIPGYLVALVSLAVLLLSRRVWIADLKKGIPWDILIMSGCLIGLGPVLEGSGIAGYVLDLASPMVTVMADNPYLFVVMVALMVTLSRYVYISVISVSATFMPLLMPIAAAAGINPWIAAFAMLTAGNIWNTIYMSPLALQGLAAFGGEEVVDFSKLSRFSFLYIVLNLVGLIASVPYWKLIGFII